MRNAFVFLAFVLIGLVVVPSTGVGLQGAIPPSERAALIALYNATDGDHWWSTGGWKAPPLEADGFSQIGSEGTWYGIRVTDNHVTRIILWGNLLLGSIPPEIENLPHLQGLYLSNRPRRFQQRLYLFCQVMMRLLSGLWIYRCKEARL